MFVPIEVNIGEMKIRNADHGGVLSLGSNVNINRNVAAKKTQGFGQQFGDRVVRMATVQAVLDDEESDASVRKKKEW